VPVAVFLLWRVLLWIGQGFREDPAAATAATPKAVHMGQGFWTVRTVALLGAVLFVTFGIFAGANGVGGLIANAAIGAILGAVMAKFLPRQVERP
jgi:hypothetical protein